MKTKQEIFRFLQVHIDAARNATDDFNPFHDPHKWNAIHNNPYGSPIALGFQLTALVESQIRVIRECSQDNLLIKQHNLAFSNYQFSFADVVRPGDEICIDIKPTVNKIESMGQLANRIAVRKDSNLVILGYQRETRDALIFTDADFSAVGNLKAYADRSFIGDGHYFLKRKFMNTSNGKNFLVGSLVDQHHYFDELKDRVQFPNLFPAALISCALLEKAQQEGYDFYNKPMVYTNHAISVDHRLLNQLRSNDCLHILIQGPDQVQDEKGLGKTDIPQAAYNCFGLVSDNNILFRARVMMALLEDVIAARK